MSMIPLGASSCARKTILPSTEQCRIFVKAWIFNLCVHLCYGKYLKVHESSRKLLFFNLHVALCYRPNFVVSCLQIIKCRNLVVTWSTRHTIARNLKILSKRSSGRSTDLQSFRCPPPPPPHKQTQFFRLSIHFRLKRLLRSLVPPPNEGCTQTGNPRSAPEKFL